MGWSISEDGEVWESLDAEDVPTDLIELYGEPGTFIDQNDLLYKQSA